MNHIRVRSGSILLRTQYPEILLFFFPPSNVSSRLHPSLPQMDYSTIPPSPIHENPPWMTDNDIENLDYDLEDIHPTLPLKKVPHGDIFSASRAGDLDRLRYLTSSGVNVNARDKWDSVALYYTCLAGHVDAARLLLENGAICSERTFDGDRCHYAALNLRIRRLLKMYEARPPQLSPLASALRGAFLGCPANKAYLDQCDSMGIPGYSTIDDASDISSFPPDLTIFVDGNPIEAHRIILSARSPYFKNKFMTDWNGRSEIRFSGTKLSYPAFYSLIHFFYSDRLEVSVADMEDLVRICKACRCTELQKLLQFEIRHQQNAEYKSLKEVDNSQKRFILQGLSLSVEDRLPSAMRRILQTSLASCSGNCGGKIDICEICIPESKIDLADVYIGVDGRIFRCHKVVLASRSEYFKARFSRMTDFLEGENGLRGQTLPFLEERDLSAETFEKMIEYMYTDSLNEVKLNQGEEIFDAASRYLLLPLKRATADALLPQMEFLLPTELCHWLLLSDMYEVLKLREYCLDRMACNFDIFADTPEFRAMLLTLPPPSGDSMLRTTQPSAPGSGGNSNQGNLLDDLREKWLEIAADALDKRDESAVLFDKRLEMLMLLAEKEHNNGD